MAKRSQTYAIPHPAAAVRALLRDPAEVGRALAFVEATEERGGQLAWRLRAPMAAITGAESLRLDYRTLTDGAVRWQAESPRLVSRGEIRALAAGPDVTVLEFSLEMAGAGAARMVIEPLAAMQIEGQMDHLVDGLQSALEAAAREGMVKHADR